MPSSFGFFRRVFLRARLHQARELHSKLRYALPCASSVPLDEIFFIPFRFENCIVPARVSGKLQDVDLFSRLGDGGLKKVVAIIARQDGIRRRKSLPLAV